MELVRIGESYDPATWVLPLEYVFRRPDGTIWTLCFVPTVPVCEQDGDELYGDLFTCPFDEIGSATRPVPRGGRREAAILDALKSWVSLRYPPDRQRSLLQARFPRMTPEEVSQISLIWFTQALERRRARHDDPDD